MTFINGKHAAKWINQNHPENGIFKVYWTKDGVNSCDWKDEISPRYMSKQGYNISEHVGGRQTSFKDKGLGVRYEWHYKDGKQIGVSKGWYPDAVGGHLFQVRNWKDGKLHGLVTEYYTNGQKKLEGTWDNGELVDNVLMGWHPCGQLWKETVWESRGKVNQKGYKIKRTEWFETGQKKSVWRFKNGKSHGIKIMWSREGIKVLEQTWKDGKLMDGPTRRPWLRIEEEKNKG